MSRRGWALFAALSILWGLPYLFIKVAVADLQPMFVVAGRLLLAAAVLVPVALVSGGRDGRALPSLAGKWRWIVLFALIEFIVPFALLTWAETKVTSSLAGLTIAAVPTISALAAAQLGLADRLDRVHQKQRPRLADRRPAGLERLQRAHLRVAHLQAHRTDRATLKLRSEFSQVDATPAVDGNARAVVEVHGCQPVHGAGGDEGAARDGAGRPRLAQHRRERGPQRSGGARQEPHLRARPVHGRRNG